MDVLNMNLTDHCDDYAKELEGNWRKFPSFAWHDRPEDADKWCIVYTHNRDSGCLERSNAECIERELKPFCGWHKDGADAQVESHGHWGCGWISGYSIRVRNDSGEYTAAFRKWVELSLAVADYPSLDDSRLSELKQAEADETWRSCYRPAERIDYIREHRSQFEFRSFADMLGCVRGKFFAGYASELLEG